jgi:hypothetical protein
VGVVCVVCVWCGTVCVWVVCGVWCGVCVCVGCVRVCGVCVVCACVRVMGQGRHHLQCVQCLRSCQPLTVCRDLDQYVPLCTNMSLSDMNHTPIGLTSQFRSLPKLSEQCRTLNPLPADRTQADVKQPAQFGPQVIAVSISKDFSDTRCTEGHDSHSVCLFKHFVSINDKT